VAGWKLYEGSGEPHDVVLPEAPPWRRFGPAPETPQVIDSDGGDAGPSTFQATPELVEAVNAALILRRPLFVTGRPGSGKSSLIESVARELQLGRVLRWHVTSRS